MVGADTSALPGVLFSLLVSDNTGCLIKGAVQALRKEICSNYFKDVTLADIHRVAGLSESAFRALSSQWRPMHLTGIETPSDLLADEESDAFVVYLRQAFVRGVDDMASLDRIGTLLRDTSQDYREDGRAIDGRGGSVAKTERRYTTVCETATYVEGTTEVSVTQLKPEQREWKVGVNLITPSDNVESDSEDGGDRAEADEIIDPLQPRRVWEMITQYPSLDLNHADIKTIAKLLMIGCRRASRVQATAAVLGDGSPTMKVSAFARAELTRLLKQPNVRDSDMAEELSAELANMNEDDDDGSSSLQDENAMRDAGSNALSTLNLIGFMHVFADSVKRAFRETRNNVAGFAPLWRNSFRKVQYLLDGTDMARCYIEFMSIATGVSRFFLDTYRAQPSFTPCNKSMDAFDEWLEQWGDEVPIVEQLITIVDLAVFLWGVRCSMRTGKIEFCIMLVKHHIELAAGTGGDHYLRLLTDFLVLFETMPETYLVVLEMLMFTDVGSANLASDEFLEFEHNWEKNENDTPYNGHIWFVGMRRSAVLLPYMRKTKDVGLWQGKGRPAIGAIEVLSEITARTFLMLIDTGLKRYSDSWKDALGVARPCQPPSGDRAAAAWFSMDGTAVTPEILTQREWGRAVAANDMMITVFGDGVKNLAITRPRLRRSNLTAAARDAAAREITERRLASTVSSIHQTHVKHQLLASFRSYKMAIEHPIGGSAQLLPTDPRVLAVRSLDRLWICVTSANKETMVRCMVKWRAYLEWTAPIDAAREADAAAVDPVDALFSQQSSWRQRRKSARERNRAMNRVVANLPLKRVGRGHGLVLSPSQGLAQLAELAGDALHVPDDEPNPESYLRKKGAFHIPEPSRDDWGNRVRRLKRDDSGVWHVYTPPLRKTLQETITSLAFAELADQSSALRSDQMRVNRADRRETSAPGLLARRREQEELVKKREAEGNLSRWTPQPSAGGNLTTPCPPSGATGLAKPWAEAFGATAAAARAASQTAAAARAASQTAAAASAPSSSSSSSSSRGRGMGGRDSPGAARGTAQGRGRAAGRGTASARHADAVPFSISARDRQLTRRYLQSCGKLVVSQSRRGAAARLTLDQNVELAMVLGDRYITRDDEQDEDETDKFRARLEGLVSEVRLAAVAEAAAATPTTAAAARA